MIHVWITPQQVRTVRRAEGVGAGQIAEGETRLCDSRTAPASSGCSAETADVTRSRSATATCGRDGRADHRRRCILVADEQREHCPAINAITTAMPKAHRTPVECPAHVARHGRAGSATCAPPRMLAMIATPSEIPTWRCVEKIDDARPFCDGSIVA